MVEAFIGTLISALTVSSLMLSIDAIEKSFRNAGKHSLTLHELEIMNSAGMNTSENRTLIQSDLSTFPQKQ